MFKGLVGARLKFLLWITSWFVTYWNLCLFGELQVMLCYVPFIWNLLILDFK